MNENMNAWGILRKLSWEDALLVLGVLVLARLVVAIIQWAIRHLAEKAPVRLRLFILRFLPVNFLLRKKFTPKLTQKIFRFAQNFQVLKRGVEIAKDFEEIDEALCCRDIPQCLASGVLNAELKPRINLEACACNFRREVPEIAK